MKARSIPFSAQMVRALLTKTQTRRIMTPQPVHAQVYEYRGKRLHDSEYRHWCWKQHVGNDNWDSITQQLGHACPYGQPGDQLWVRENYRFGFGYSGVKPSTVVLSPIPLVQYEADDELRTVAGTRVPWQRFTPGDLRPSIFMPRKISRITLEITDVRVQRLHEISDEDAKAEGAEPTPRSAPDGSFERGEEYISDFCRIWTSINGPDSWRENPWVWAITFKRVTP